MLTGMELETKRTLISGSMGSQTAPQLGAVHQRHIHIRYQQMDRPGVLLEDLQGFTSSPPKENLVPVPQQAYSDHPPCQGIVVHDQDRLLAHRTLNSERVWLLPRFGQWGCIFRVKALHDVPSMHFRSLS